MRKPAAAIAALTLFLTAAVAPVSAAPPEQFDEPIFFIFPDFQNELAVFWNITRDDFCAWEESEFDGPPPVTTLVSVLSKETANGAVVGSWRATSTLELWQFDADADLSGACQDTDDSDGPWATGSATVRANDNDVFVSGSRTNAFGDRGNGTVWETGTGAAWQYSWTFRALIDRDGEFRAVVDQTALRRR